MGSTADTKTILAARLWKGESFILLSNGVTSQIIKDMVLRFEFKLDGSCSLSQASYSVTNVSGVWRLENNDSTIVFTLNRSVGTITETLPIKELSNSRFVFGDTTQYGYSLIPF